jgi:hypothetical protein
MMMIACAYSIEQMLLLSSYCLYFIMLCSLVTPLNMLLLFMGVTCVLQDDFSFYLLLAN